MVGFCEYGTRDVVLRVEFLCFCCVLKVDVCGGRRERRRREEKDEKREVELNGKMFFFLFWVFFWVWLSRNIIYILGKVHLLLRLLLFVVCCLLLVVVRCCCCEGIRSR